MKSLKITIPYTPKAKGSWRMGRFGTYNPSQRGMNKTREFVKSLTPEHPFISGPILCIVHLRIPAPNYVTYNKRKAQHLTPHIKKPDGDNLEKFLNDALNGIAWYDDSHIVWMVRSKTITQAKEGETIIYIQELPSTKPDYNLLLNAISQHIQIEPEAENVCY